MLIAKRFPFSGFDSEMSNTKEADVTTDESHELTAGQSIQFDALLPHSYEALENTECIIVHLKKPKRF